MGGGFGQVTLLGRELWEQGGVGVPPSPTRQDSQVRAIACVERLAAPFCVTLYCML